MSNDKKTQRCMCVTIDFEQLTFGELRKFVEKAGLEVSSLETVTREKRPPHFEVISLIAHRP